LAEAGQAIGITVEAIARPRRTVRPRRNLLDG
jgi:hypothetical protein